MLLISHFKTVYRIYGYLTTHVHKIVEFLKNRKKFLCLALTDSSTTGSRKMPLTNGLLKIFLFFFYGQHFGHFFYNPYLQNN